MEFLIFFKREKLTIALIGAVCERKGQIFFAKAVESLPFEARKKAVFKIIGAVIEPEYCERVTQMLQSQEDIEMCGSYPHNEMDKLYEDIDVVVSASLEDPLPIVLTEGMMHQKVVVATDRTGNAKFIQNKENGFVYKAGDVTELTEVMQYVIEREDEHLKWSENGRKVYEEYFTMESFGERLEKAIIDTEEKWNREVSA